MQYLLHRVGGEVVVAEQHRGEKQGQAGESHKVTLSMERLRVFVN
jgi:hypothetical protein